jgi:hypothetical protein
MLKWIAILFVFMGGLAHAERRHTIALSGAVRPSAPHELTVETLTKDFPTLSAVTTEWRSEGKHEFKGVLLRDFVKKYAQAGVMKVKVTATNDYSQELSEKDLQEWDALLAFQEDGQVITTKNKGTFRIVYDYHKYDRNMAVKSMLENNSVWQVIKTEFVK